MLNSGDKLQKLLTVLFTWVLLLALFFAYEGYFVKSQKEFLSRRGFRVLASLANDLDSKINEAQSKVVSAAKLGQGMFPSYLKLYLGEELGSDESLRAALACLGAGRQPKWVPEQNGLRLNISCSAEPVPPGSNASPASGELPSLTLDLGQPVRNSFHKLDNFFDDVWIASLDGHVRFHESSTIPSVTDLKGVLPPEPQIDKKSKGSESADANSNGSETTKASPKKTGPRPNPPAGPPPVLPESAGLRTLGETSTSTKINLAGVDYILFTQPLVHPLGSGDQRWSLIICGLRRSESFESETHAVPFSILIWAVLIGIALFSLSWPLFKLRYMSNTERFSPKDGWYLFLAVFLTSCSVMLMLLNASYTSWQQSATDQNLTKLAEQIKRNFDEETHRAFQQLQDIAHDPLFTSAPRDVKKATMVASYLGQTARPVEYPYFEIVFWANCGGAQLVKFDVRPVTTPPTVVASFDFFRDVISDLRWIKGSKTTDPACPDVPAELATFEHSHFQTLLSPNTDEYAPVLSIPFFESAAETGPGKIPVQAMALRPMSVVDAVLPPGYGFAVVDVNCEVLFHSDAIRDLKENFCQESKNTEELQPWLQSGANTSLDITYLGKPERAYLTSLPFPGLSTGNAFLIVFQEPDRELTLNLAIMLVCSLLMVCYFLVPLLAAGIHLSLRGPLHLIYAPRVLWPCPDNALIYARVFAGEIFMMLLYWFGYSSLYEAPLLVVTLSVVSLSVLYVDLMLQHLEKVLYHFGIALTAMALLLLGATFLSSAPSLADWRLVIGYLAAFGIVGILLSGRFPGAERLGKVLPGESEKTRSIVREHFSLVYALASVSVITAIAFVPCVSFFKYAYDAVSELSLKRDQLLVSKQVLDRRDGVRSYYEQIGAPQTGVKRIAETLDRYDRCFFTIRSEPSLESEPLALNASASEPCLAPNGEYPGRTFAAKPGINEWVEKILAQATLRFPSNQIGLEMSKLGVASSGNKGIWEHGWKELDPEVFRLAWKPESRLANFSVTSRYLSWQGLSWEAYFFLGALWVVLTLWLSSIVKRIFFTDIEGTTPFDTVNWKATADIGHDYLVIGPAKSGKTRQLRDLRDQDRVAWLDLRLELGKKVKDQNYQITARKLSVLVLDHFEINLRDRDYNRERLTLLESLAYDPPSKLVLVSTVDPLYYLTDGAPEVLTDSKDLEAAPRLLDRWARVLSKFSKVSLPASDTQEFDQRLDDFLKKYAKSGPFVNCVRDECRSTAFLRETGIELLKHVDGNHPPSRNWVVNCVLDRADAYYHVLWSGLTANERLVLYQLALDGWANAKNTAAIEQLERKLLIFRTPMYQIMNESFRRFIESTEHSDEIVQWEKRELRSTWRALRFVVVAVVVGVAVWLLYSQAALSQTVVGYIAGIAALLSAVGALSARFKKPVPAAPEASQD
jgi:hypothetical protein